MSSKQPKRFFVNEQFKNSDHNDMDTIQLLRIFPEETWKVILEKVTNLKSLENLSLASRFFRERLMSRRLTFLFPGVFECLIKRHEQDPLDFSIYTINWETNSDKNIADTDENVSVSDLSSSDSDVASSDSDVAGSDEDVAGSDEDVAGSEEDTAGSDGDVASLDEDEASSDEDVAGSNEDVADSDSDVSNIYSEYTADQIWEFPWVLRLMCKSWNKSIEDYFQKPKINYFFKEMQLLKISTRFSDYSLMLTHILPKFGKTIKRVQLNLCFEEGENLAEYYLILKKFLDSLTSLQELEILMSKEGKKDFERDFEITEAIDMNPCSELMELEIFSVNWLPSPILRELVRSNSGFKTLKLLVDNGQRLTFDFSMHLPNLNNLDITIEKDEDFQQLKRFAKNWRLTSFCGMFRHFTKKTFWMEVCKMIGDNWGDTLEELSLYMPIVVGFRAVPVASVCKMIIQLTTDKRLEKMKVLKKVEIQTGYAISLDFLLPCKETLEEMEIMQLGGTSTNHLNPHYCYGLARQVVEYLGKEKEMEGSNVWDLFPKLKSYKGVRTEVKRPA